MRDLAAAKVRGDETLAARIGIAQFGHSLFTLYLAQKADPQTRDDIVGVLYAKDLLTLVDAGDGPRPVTDLMRPAYFVPETKRVAELSQALNLGPKTLVVVNDISEILELNKYAREMLICSFDKFIQQRIEFLTVPSTTQPLYTRLLRTSASLPRSAG